MIFNLRGVVEIALRALSPGINDPFTAIACIDHLTSALGSIMQRQLRDPIWCDKSGTARLLTIRPEFRDLVDTAFNDIRDFGSTQASVQKRLLESLMNLARLIANAEQRSALKAQAERLRHTLEQGSIHPLIAKELLLLCDEMDATIDRS